MILELPTPAARNGVRNDRRTPATVNDPRRTPGSALMAPSSGYSRVMNQVEAGRRQDASVEKTAAEPSKEFSYWEGEKFAFGDFLDIINPLHHIPIVATIYRNFTADKIGFVPRVVGGALWGRVGGFVAGLVNAAVEWFSGKDIGEHIFAAIWGKNQPEDKAGIVQAEQGRSNDPKAAAVTAPEARQAPPDLLPPLSAATGPLRHQTGPFIAAPEFAQTPSRFVLSPPFDCNIPRGRRPVAVPEPKRTIRLIA